VYHCRKGIQSIKLELRRKLWEVESELKTINKFLEATNQISKVRELPIRLNRPKEAQKESYRLLKLSMHLDP